MQVTQFLAKVVSEPRGGDPSSMRFAVLILVGNIMLVWTIICLKKLELVPIDTTAAGLIGAALFAKAVQRGRENSPSNPNPEEEPHA